MTTRTAKTSPLLLARVAGFTFLFYIAATFASVALSSQATSISDNSWTPGSKKWKPAISKHLNRLSPVCNKTKMRCS